MLKNKFNKFTCTLLSTAMIIGNIFPTVNNAYAFEVEKQSTYPDGSTKYGLDTEDIVSTETAYINDTPIRLQVSKVKTAKGNHEGLLPVNNSINAEDTVTYKYSGRIEGDAETLISTYGTQNIELAYTNSGTYLGYGWLKGTLEYLQNRQAEKVDDSVEIMYNSYGIFEGYAYITKKLETRDDTNRYVAGATMALYDAVEIMRDPAITRDGKDEAEDKRFKGVTVERESGSNNVKNVYVQKGWAGTKTEYVLQKKDGTKINVDEYGKIIDKNYNYQDAINDTGDGVWIAKTIQREDTPILYYSLDNLRITTNDIYTSVGYENDQMIDDIFGADRFDKENKLYGFDKLGNVVDITQVDERDFSIYGFVAGDTRPTFEFVIKQGNDKSGTQSDWGKWDSIRYNMPEKRIVVGTNVLMYHLDKDGNRDSLVDPQTGIAYIEEEIDKKEGHTNIHADNDAPDLKTQTDTKIYVWPVNITYDGSGANQGNAKGSKRFHKMISSRIATINADTQNEYTTGTIVNSNSGLKLEKSMNPVLDMYGRVVYYRNNDGLTYVKGQDTYDYDGDEYTGYIYDDQLDKDNELSYSVNNHDKLYNGDKDDPFNQTTHYQYSTQQSVYITVDTTSKYVSNGNKVVPVPTRDGYKFNGWLVSIDNLTDGMTVKASWSRVSDMSQSMKNTWYGSIPAAGQTKTYKIIFDANGGEFKIGEGDIHSTDNLLYHRLGENLLIENVWTSGEHTPNDPTDVQKIDTVKNTADHSNTISNSNKTGNDVYSNTANAGGQADMLKRVNTGVYIMEELAAPAGYVKSLPVGVTVNEDTHVQKTEMTDKTIKIELIKQDSTDSFNRYLYINGVLQKNSANTNYIVTENKGNWSYTHVPDAILAFKPADQASIKPLSDWVEVTSNTQITKQGSDRSYYFTFNTSSPLYLEGLPAGNYVISEVNTPKGYVTMQDQKITITETDDVQTFTMNDDHTKVEIDKYYNFDNTDKNMPNTYRAELTLNDRNGNKVATWYTDDVSDYTSNVSVANENLWDQIITSIVGENKEKSFVELFTEAFNQNKKFETISWKVERVATLSSSSTENNEIWLVSDGSRVNCKNGSAPDTAPAAFKAGYNGRNLEENFFIYEETFSAVKDTANTKTMADQIWNVTKPDGSVVKLHVSAEPENLTNGVGKQNYKVHFKFNYRDDYSGDYTNMISYDTIEGKHRFDYIPTSEYTLVETKVPEGYASTGNRTFTVQNNGDIQRFRMENARRQIKVAKLANINDTYYAGSENDVAIATNDISKAAVISGARLSLYYSENQISNYADAFANNNIPAGVSLADTWVSGADGKYTRSEYNQELITEDKIGDFKPHSITDIRNGYYYLVETETPAHYQTMAVKEIKVTANSTADELEGVTAINKLAPMTVKLFKYTNKNDTKTPLANAVFTVKNKTLGGIVVGTIVTDANGNGELTINETGRLTANGNIEPYTFTVEETQAPKGYGLNKEIHEFKASETLRNDISSMFNLSDASIVDGVLYVENEQSVISISKKDFDTPDLFVTGAKLAMYVAKFENDAWVKDTARGHWEWTTTDDESKAFKGLEANQTYLVTELEAPKGYTKAKDIYFQVNNDCTAIKKIWYAENESPYITFTEDNTGAVENVYFKTRTVAGTYITLTDLDNNTTKTLGSLTNGEVNLSSEDVTEGHRYQMNEWVRYSDNTEEKLASTTFIAKLNNNWMKLNTQENIQKITMNISDENGNTVTEFDTKGSETVINNPLYSDPNSLTVITSMFRRAGVDHKSVQLGDQIRYQISYSGKGKEIIVFPAKGLTYLTASGMTLNNDGSYSVVTDKESGTFLVVGKVNENAIGYIDQQVSIDGQPYEYINPVAVNAGTGVFQNSSKLVIFNNVQGTNPDNDNAAFTYKVTLTKADGSPLTGQYAYRTKNTNGVLSAFETNTSFVITVNGSDFITIQDLPYNTQYSVVQIIPDNYNFTVTNGTASGKTSNTEVSNVLFTNTRNLNAERMLFQKNTTYIVSERLQSASDYFVLNKRSFTMDEKCSVKELSMLDKKTKVNISKVDWSDYTELAGAEISLLDSSKNIVKDKNGKEIKWISETTPYVIEGELTAGETYYLHENYAPLGFNYSEDIKFTVSLDGTVDKVIMEDKPNKVEFYKVDEDTMEEIPNAQFTLYKVNSNNTLAVVEDWTSGTTPHISNGKLDCEQKYVLEETKAPNGYSYAHSIMFELDKTGKVINAKNVDIENNTVTNESTEKLTVEDNKIIVKDKAFTVYLRKTDFSNNKLTGVSAELYKVTNDNTLTLVDKWITEEDDHALTSLEAGCTYRYHEVLSIDGYEYSQDIQFTVGRDGKVTESYFVNKDGEVILSTSTGYAINAVKHNDGTYTYNGETATYNSTLHTLTDAQGNNISNIVENFTVSNNVVVMQDAPLKIKILKINNETNKPISGGKYQILNIDGTPVNALYTDKNFVKDQPLIFKAAKKGVELERHLLAGHKYLLRELEAPHGYTMSGDVEFETPYYNDPEVIQVSMGDKPTEAYFTKSGAGTELLDGVLLVLYKVKDDNTLSREISWYSSEMPYTLRRIIDVNSTYIIREEKAIEGYSYTNDIMFNVIADGTIINPHYVNEDRETLLYDKDGYVTNIIKTLDNTYKTTDDKTVTIDEEGNAICEGVVIAHGVKDVISMANTNFFNIKDMPTKVRFYKMNTDGEILTGGKFQILDSNKKVVRADKKTNIKNADNTGYITEGQELTFSAMPTYVDIINLLEAGETYYIHEVEAPEGYLIADDVEFTVPYYNSKDPVIVEMIDKPTEVTLNKTDFAGEEVPDALINIKEVNDDDSDTTIDEWTSTDTPHEIKGRLEPDKTYQFHEEAAPDGYNYSEDIQFKLDEDGNVYDAHYVDDNGNTVLYDKDGYPTDIIVHEDGTYSTGGSEIFVSKQNIAGDEIPGAKIEIRDRNTNELIDSWTSKVDAHVVKLGDGQYKLIETLPPTGYEKITEIEFEIKDGKLTDGSKDLVMVDEYAENPIKISKYDILHNVGEIPGAKLTLTNESGETVEEWISEIEPHTVYITDGTYTLTEAAPPNGYYPAESITFTIKNGKLLNGDDTVTMYDIPQDTPYATISVSKQDITNSKELPGATLKVIADNVENPWYSSENNTPKNINGTVMAEWVSTDTPHMISLPDGDYTLVEITAPYGYEKSEFIEFTIKDGKLVNHKDEIITMKDKVAEKHNISISKKDVADSHELPGATLVVKNNNGDVIKQWVSTNTPVTISISDGYYRLIEITAPKGYKKTESIGFNVKDGKVFGDKDQITMYNRVEEESKEYHKITIDENGNAVDENGEIHAEGVKETIEVKDNGFQMKDSPTQVRFLKIDNEGKLLEGGKFQILNSDGSAVNAKVTSVNNIFEANKPLIFAANTKGVNITGQLTAGRHYILRELEAPAGYLLSEDAKFYVPYLNSKEPITVKMDDIPTHARVSKVDSEDKKPVIGATLEIRKESNGDLIDQWITTEEPHDLTGLLSVGTKYVITEIDAPDGYYVLSKPVIFMIDPEKDITSVVVENTKTKVVLKKIDNKNNQELSGGHFSIIRKSDNAVIIPEFELDGHKDITGLVAGETYLFHEITAPKGYKVSSDVEFTVPLNQPKNIQIVSMADNKKTSGGSITPSLSIKKYDGLTMQTLSGAEFTIYNEQGKVYKVVNTNQFGQAYITFTEMGKYTFKETKAPKGYLLDDTVHEFTIDHSSTITKNVANYPDQHVTIIKKDAKTGEVIKGVTFEIMNEEGKVVYTGVTDEYGQITFAPDSYGAYAVRETAVPSDYILNEDGYITFTVSPSGVQGDLTFYNDKTTIIKPNKGKITAEYDNGSKGYGKGWFDRDGNWHPWATIVKTGDYYPFALLFGLLAIGVIGFILTSKKKGAK